MVVLHQLYLSLIPLFLLIPLVHQHIALVKASTFLKELQVPRISSTACRNYDQNRLLCGSLDRDIPDNHDDLRSPTL
jgi:hypothetical protein